MNSSDPVEPGTGERPKTLSSFLKLRLVETAQGAVQKGDGTLSVIPIPASYKVSPHVPHLTRSLADEELNPSSNYY